MSRRRTHEPAIRSPELQKIVDEATAQRSVRTSLDFERVRLASTAVRRQRRRYRGFGVALGASAVGMLIYALGIREPAEDARLVDAHEAQVTVDAAALAREPIPSPEVVDSVPPRLDSAVRLTSLEGELRVLNPWEAEVVSGRHRFVLADPSSHHLRLRVGQRRLDLSSGELEVQGDTVILSRGVAAWVDDEGKRTELSVKSSSLELGAKPKRNVETAASLAKKAEARVRKGDRRGAIRLLRRLVRNFPKAPETRMAVVDMGGLLVREGRKDEARCAYGYYLERWPGDHMHSTVESRRRQLGEGLECRGLRPQKSTSK